MGAVPYFSLLGFSVQVKDGRLEGHLPFRESNVGNPTLPALHGGVLGAVLEATAQFELLHRAESLVLPKTITLTIDYLRSGKPLHTTVVSDVLKHGRRVATVQARAFQEDPAAPIAIATVHLLVLAD